METIPNGTQSQGDVEYADKARELPEPDVATIKKWLERDLGACISFLSALYNDAELRSQLAVWLKGRIQNQKNAERLKREHEKQGELFKE